MHIIWKWAHPHSTFLCLPHGGCWVTHCRALLTCIIHSSSTPSFPGSLITFCCGLSPVPITFLLQWKQAGSSKSLPVRLPTEFTVMMYRENMGPKLYGASRHESQCHCLLTQLLDQVTQWSQSGCWKKSFTTFRVWLLDAALLKFYSSVSGNAQVLPIHGTVVRVTSDGCKKV